MSKWYENTVKWMQLNSSYVDPATCDDDYWKRYFLEIGAEALLLSSYGVVAFYHSDFYKQKYAVGVETRDYFGEWSSWCHEHNIRVIARMDMTATPVEFAEERDGWLCKNKEGKPIPEGGGYACCVNSGYYTEFIPKVLKELIEKYKVDGFGDNNWSGLSVNAICYCDNCKARFKKDCGLELPEKIDMNDPVYRRYLKWSFETRNENYKFLVDTVKKYGGDECVWCGMLHPDFRSVYYQMHDLKTLPQYEDMIIVDYQMRHDGGGFEDASSMVQLIKNVANVPVTACLGQYSWSERIYRLASGVESDRKSWALNCIAGGARPCFHFFGGDTLDKRKYNLANELYPWVDKMRDKLFRGKNVATVGMVWTMESIYYTGKFGTSYGIVPVWGAYLKALSKAGIPCMPIHADDIDKFPQVKTLIFPNMKELSKVAESKIVDFINRGGNILLSGQSGLNENLEKKKETPLWDKLGLKWIDQTEESMYMGVYDYGSIKPHSYIILPKERTEIFDGLEETDIVPFGGSVQKIESAKLKGFGEFAPPFQMFPPEFGYIHEVDKDAKFIYQGVLDSGSRVVYFAADIDRRFNNFHINDLMTIMVNSVKWLVGDETQISTSSAGKVNTTAYIDGKKLYIHLLNVNADDYQVGVEHLNLPVENLEVQVRFDTSNSAKGLYTNKEYVIEDGKIKVGKLDEYEFLEIDLK